MPEQNLGAYFACQKLLSGSLNVPSAVQVLESKKQEGICRWSDHRNVAGPETQQLSESQGSFNFVARYAQNQ